MASVSEPHFTIYLNESKYKLSILFEIFNSFRHPPKLIMSATPAVGETTFDWDIITSTIESKLYEEVLKYLVYPNMVDVILPILGQSTYRDTATGAAE